MRFLVAFALLALVASPGQALVGEVLAPLRLEAPERDGGVDGPSDAPTGPHARIVLRTEGQPRDLVVNLTDAAGGGAIVHEVHLQADDEVVLHEPWPQAPFRVRVTEFRNTAPAQVPPGLPVQTGTRQSIDGVGDLRGCDGAFLVTFGFTSTDWEARSPGCLAKPAGFDALVAEVRAALRDPRGAPVEVPMPGDADEGYYEGTAGRAAFRWSPRERAVGPEGEVHEGPALRWISGAPITAGAGWSFDLVPGLPPVGDSDSLVIHDIPFVLRFDPGALDPWSSTAFIAGASASAARLGSIQVGFVQEVALSSSNGACLVRNPLQGRALTPGEHIPEANLCRTAGLPRDAWTVGNPGEVRGFRAVPLAMIHDDPEGRTTVARLWFAEGVPYPLQTDFASHAPEQPSFHHRMELRGLRGAGAPLLPGPGVASSPPPPEAPVLAPLDPLRGPALGDARARVPFPLDEAADAALGNPLLRRLQDLVAREGALLAVAELDRRPVAGSDAEELVWALGFAAPGTDPVWVHCTRPFAASPGLAAPVARCEERVPDPRVTSQVILDPAASADRLPASTVPWEVALARWDQQDPTAGAVTFARYVPLGDWRWFAPGPRLDLGRHFPLLGTPGALPALEEASFVGTDLLTGRATLVGSGTSRDTGLGVVPAFIAPRPAVQGSGLVTLGAEAPMLVGATAAGLLLLLLGGLLYTRLSRPKLLEQEVRAKAYALVAEEPGLHASEVARRLGGGNGLAEYHLGVLVREGYLTTLATPGFRRYFVTGKVPPAEMRARAALAQGKAAAAMQAVQARPGLTLRELALQLGVQDPAASKTVDRLAAAGLVERRRQGRVVRLYPQPGAALPDASSPAEA